MRRSSKRPSGRWPEAPRRPRPPPPAPWRRRRQRAVRRSRGLHSGSSTHISNCSGSAPCRNVAISEAMFGLGFQDPFTSSASTTSVSSGLPIMSFIVCPLLGCARTAAPNRCRRGVSPFLPDWGGSMMARARPDPHQGGGGFLPRPSTPLLAGVFHRGDFGRRAAEPDPSAERVRATISTDPRVARTRRCAPAAPNRRGGPGLLRCKAATRQGRTFPTGAAAKASQCQARLLLVHPVVDVLLDPVLGITVARLNLAFELIVVAIDLGDIIIGKLAPLLLHLTAELLPAAFDAIPIHVKPPVCCC